VNKNTQPSLEVSLWYARLILFLSILCVSTSAILNRLAGNREVGAFTVAGFRLLYASLALLAIAWPSRIALQRALRSQWRWFTLSTLSLAIHMGTWTLSLYYIPVARSLALVETHPLFVLLASWLAFGERPKRGMLIFLGTALLGTLWMMREHLGSDPADFTGDALALVGAASLPGYLIAGRKLRASLTLPQTAGPVYLAAGVLLLLLALVQGQSPLHSSLQDHGLFLAIALLPTLGGHALLQWSLRHFRAPVVSAALLGEPVLGAWLAYVVFQEVPGSSTLQGGLLCLVGLLGVVLTAKQG